MCTSIGVFIWCLARSPCCMLEESTWCYMWAPAWIPICLRFAWEDSTPSIEAHTSLDTYSALLFQLDVRLLCDMFVCFLPSSCIKRHSDPQFPPSAVPVIKDTDVTTKFKTSTCRQYSMLRAYAPCLFRDLSVCGRVCLCVFALITSYVHTQACVFSLAQIASCHCCSSRDPGTQHQGWAAGCQRKNI